MAVVGAVRDKKRRDLKRRPGQCKDLICPIVAHHHFALVDLTATQPDRRRVMDDGQQNDSDDAARDNVPDKSPTQQPEAAPVPAPGPNINPVAHDKPAAPAPTVKQPKVGFNISKIRDPLDGSVSRALHALDINARTARELGLTRSPIDDIIMGRNQLSTVARAIAEADKVLKLGGGIARLNKRLGLANASISAAGGIEKIMRQQREMERMISGLGGLDSIIGRHSAMRDAVSAMGGFDIIMKRHEETNRLAMGTLAPATHGYVGSAALTANLGIERAMRDIAGVTSFTGLLGRTRLDRARFNALVAETQTWRATAGSLSLSEALHAQLPDLIPELRRATAADIAGAGLSSLGERFARDAARFARIQDEMLSLRRLWVDVANPGQSVAAYVDARALTTIVETGPPESRAVVTAVREELGDYRETEAVPEVVAADPVLRSAFRLEVGYNADLSSLPPAILAAIFAPLGGGIPRRKDADHDAIESVVHQRARRLELKLRRFIEKKMIAAAGSKWSKQRVPGDTVRRWRERRQLDLDNGRAPSRLFDYAGFEDYRAIIDQKNNWEDVFVPVFKVKSSILETLRRLSLIRNPDAHYRIVTIEDFLDLHTEGRRLDTWIDAAS
ncbi:hypothetical protein [Mesorhizobium sp. M0146]|uniref:hypothetical protein n=1 Tax=unclassified Mesorhizobium TaxID=325217 RepID=UPI00333C2493